jgi:hypothetical protein
MAPTIAPIMHRIDIDMYYFWVPNRQLWDQWKDFVTGGDDGTATPAHPTYAYAEVDKAKLAPGSLADYLGVPAMNTANVITADVELNALPFRAYWHIYNEWFRDKDLESKVDIDYTVSGKSAIGSLANLTTAAYEKDYFTSARPNAQLGNPVNFVSELWEKVGGTSIGADTLSITNSSTAFGGQHSRIHPTGDLNQTDWLINKSTINDLRQAEAMQSYLERLQRLGNRYQEHMLGVWGSKQDNLEIDVPLLIGHKKAPITISEVLNTNGGTATAPGNNTELALGYMAGHGISAGSNVAKVYCKEHGWIMGLAVIRPKTSYSLGLHKQWYRSDKFDYALPDFALIGEQQVDKKEIYFNHADADTPTHDEAFGYQQRFAEYKYKNSSIHGDFHPFSSSHLPGWELNRNMVGTPLLNQDFIDCSVAYNDLNRIFQVTVDGVDPFWCNFYFKHDAILPLPYQSIPDMT